jgi:hypothetical protein
MAKLGDLIVNVGANTTDFNKKMGDIRKGASNTFGNIQRLGVGLSAAVTAPMAMMATQGVNAFREQQKAIAQVEAGLKSTGNQVGYTSKQLQQMASNLQSKTLFGDEEILKNATSQLLTFTNISGEQFDRTQKAALDLATRLDGDLKGASIQLGKALNDPVANLSALSRSGIQFSSEQKELINSMVEMNDLAGAQTLILDELEKQYGGSAEAAAEADGGITQLANEFGDLQEQIGGVIMKALKPLLGFVRKVIKGFQGLSDNTKTFIVAAGAIVAAIGPVLVILPQLATVAKTIGPLLGQAFTAMTGPIGIAILAIAAIAAAIYYFWDDVKVPLMNVINFFIELYNENEALRVAIAILKTAFVSTFKIAKQLIMGVIDSFGLLFKAIKTAFTDGFGAAWDVLQEGFADIKNGFIDLGTDIASDFVDAVNDAKTKEPLELVTEEDMDGAMDRFQSLFDWFSDTADSNPVEVKVVPTASTKPLVLGEIADLDVVDDFEDDLDFDPSTFLAKLEKMRAATAQAMNDIEAAVKNAAGSLLYDMGNAIGQIISEGAQSVNLMGVALQNLANLLQEIGKALIQQAVAMIAFKKLLFKNPVAAAAAGVAFVAAGAILASKAKTLEAPALAQGGLAYGPTQAIVGDNQGAKIDPEVIAPLSKLKDMMGGSQVEVFGRISGNDIFLSNARTGTSRNRYA